MDDLTIQIGASAKAYKEELDKVRSATDDLSSQLEGIALKAGIAFAAVTASIGLAVDAYRQQEQTALQTNAILKATGDISGLTASQVEELAQAFSSQTTFSKVAVEQAENVLLTFTNIGGDVMPKATQATLDLATRMGTDASSAAHVLGRALQDPLTGVNMLRRAGIQFTADQKAQITAMMESGNIAGAQAIILANVEKSMSGASQAAAAGTGVFVQLKNSTEELSEKLGAQFAPILISVAQSFKGLIDYLSESPETVKFVAAAMEGLAAALGSIVVVSAAGAAWVAFTTALEAAGVATGAMTLATRALVGATGLGLVVLAVSEIASHWNTVWPEAQAIFQTFVSQVSSLAQGVGAVLKGVFSLDKSTIQQGLDQITQTMTTGWKSAYQTAIASTKPAAVSAQRDLNESVENENKKAILQLQADQTAHNKAMGAIRNAENQATMLAYEHASSELIGLAKERVAALKTLADQNFTGDKSAVKSHLAEIQALYDEAYNQDINRNAQFYSNLQKNAAHFNLLDSAQQKNFIAQHQQQIAASIQTETSAREKFIQDQLKIEIDFHNQFLQDEIKFGQSYASIKEAMNVAISQVSQSGLNDLSQMTRSNNETLKEIGKAAAVTQITIKTAQAAMNIYEGFSVIPFIGPALGVAAAAAAIAYGAEQIGSVLAAADGGLVTGGIPGKDSVPALLMPGELVAPAQNFDEVVNAVANQRAGVGGPAGSQSVDVNLTVEMKGNVSRFITISQNKDKALGISRARS